LRKMFERDREGPRVGTRVIIMQESTVLANAAVQVYAEGEEARTALCAVGLVFVRRNARTLSCSESESR
jgi:hypothetical protein